MPADLAKGIAEPAPYAAQPETSIQKNLIESNKVYAANFTQGHLALPPAKKYAVGTYHPQYLIRSNTPQVTCMDARIDPSAAFGIALGDAHIIRNAGGSARDALRSLVISQQLLGTNEILLIKHTGCGMLTFQNDDAVKLVGERLGEGAKEELQHFGDDFQSFTHLEAEVERDVHWLRAVDLIPRQVGVSGWVYEVESGKVRRVV
ncbi:hypothetical protein EYC84_006401 [Monilinia fructicola]|uniref:Carbonic anhydrase n=1 Tax=Monilinia fructicola TaxID=38448 RepID=A0A5M9KBF6_MONFR|nr:hypothetical protein EYC84_006401 [Monilinia fructicola]